MNLNKTFLIGRLAADPETRTTPSGQLVATLRIATNRVWSNRQTNQKQEQVEFHTVIAWGRLAEIAQKYLLKGQMVFIEGRLQTRSWQGADGVKRYRTEIVAENLQLGPKAGRPSSQVSQPAAERPDAETAARVEPDLSRKNIGNDLTSAAGAQPRHGDDDIPVIDQEAPVANPIISDDEVEETEIDLKEIPF